MTRRQGGKWFHFAPAARSQKTFGKVSGWKTIGMVLLVCASMALAAQAQTFTTLVTFDANNGAFPFAPLTQGADGNLYGLTVMGGDLTCFIPYYGFEGCGTVFKVTRGGTLTTLYSFCTQPGCVDGSDPWGFLGLVQATDGNFYSVTSWGGYLTSCSTDGCGTVFKISPAGSLKTLHIFSGTDGYWPNGLIQAADGNFYGTTNAGGTNGAGTVFKITSSGTLTVIYNFCSLTGCADGSQPLAGLIQATDGNFYGTTETGGRPKSYGTVFRITPGGKLTTLHKFNGTDGSDPYGSLIQATDGNLYGTTTDASLGGYGTVFKISRDGTFTTLHFFDGSDGEWPDVALIQAIDGNLYGTTWGGGTGNSGICSGCGTVFKITPAGMLTTLYNFCTQPDCADGLLGTGLVEATNGMIYGTTAGGGNSGCLPEQTWGGCGTIFSLDLGLGPFVAFVRNPAKVGQTFGILGQGLTGTSGVLLNGTPASFRVKSDTLLTATVPVGATTGYVTVTTPSGILTSNVPFQVIR